ncbi:hypothetical protein [Pseudonocardia phyllosphaerae]|uniref:hypothetical protein n=1 Tax=Pseudonocardia phyllosphaerae TaxID=3390502 RepID=UPI00397A9AFB
MSPSRTTRIGLIVAGAAALAVPGGIAQAATPAPTDSAPGKHAPTRPGHAEPGNTPVYLLRDVPAAPLPQDLLTPVDLTGAVYGLLPGAG